MGAPDYAHDSLAEIIFAQREQIAALQVANVHLALDNLELRESADDTIAGEYDRLVDALILVEHWVHAHVEAGHRKLDAAALTWVLKDCFEYAEQKREPAWYEAAVRAMGGLG